MFYNTSTNTASLTNTWTNSAVYTLPFTQTTLKITGPTRPRADPRIINRYLNASDLLAEFIGELGTLGVRQGEVLAIPIELFINWLIVRAAEEDNDPDAVSDIAKLPDPAKLRRDRCRCCGRFIARVRREAAVFFCSGQHLDQWMRGRP